MARRFLGLIILLHGCVSIPDHELATVSTESGLELSEKDALNAGFATGEWPNLEWWKEYDDPILNQLIDSALSESPTLKIAEERLNTAAQITIEKRATLFPDISFDGNDNYQHFSKYGFFRSLAPAVPAVINDVTLNLTYRWEIDFWGKQRNILNAALGEVRAKAAELEGAKLILTTSVAYDYAELQFMLRKKEILEEKHRNDESILTIRSNRERNALDTALQILGAKIDSLNVEASLAELDGDIKNQIHEIKALAGMSQDHPLFIPKHQLKTSITKLPTNLSIDLLARRPDLAAQKERLESAAKLIDAAKIDFYPSVNLMGFAGVESLKWGNIFREGSFNGSLEPAIHLPIFTAGRIRAQMMEKVAEFNQAVEAYNSLILYAANDVAIRLTNLIRIDREIQVRTASLFAAAKQQEIVKKRMDEAIDNKISYLQMRNNFLDIQLTLTTLEYGKQLANILLIRSLGGGTHE
jgi:NodT family efflux transporter outer membrane factor (OMF) lipoprotein